MCRWMTKFRGNSRFYAETGSEVVIKSYVDEKSRGNHWFLCQKQQQQPVARATEGRPEREETSDPRATLREHDYVTNIEIIRWLRNIIRNHIDLSHLMSLVTEARSRMWYLILTLNFILWFDWLLLMTTTYSPFYFSEVISIYIYPQPTDTNVIFVSHEILLHSFAECAKRWDLKSSQNSFWYSVSPLPVNNFSTFVFNPMKDQFEQCKDEKRTFFLWIKMKFEWSTKIIEHDSTSRT